MNDFLNVIKRDRQLQIKTKEMLDKYNFLEYDTLIHNIILKEILKLMKTTIVDIHIELKMKISR